MKKGAALILSGPGIRSDVTVGVRNHDHYFALQALKWYRCAKDRGWTIKNGTLVLITACFWVESWGYATYCGNPTPQKITATFAAREDGNYYWKFPPDLDLGGLSIRTHLHRQKQCVAFKAYSIHCEDGDWKEAFHST